MKRKGSTDGQPLRRRLGTVLLIMGMALLAVPIGVWVYNELAYRYQMAHVPTPSPVMLAPLESALEEKAPQGKGPEGKASVGEVPAELVGGHGAGQSHTATGHGVGHAGDSGAGAGEAEGADTFSTYMISIPRIGVTYLVGEGTANHVLDQGPGHYPQTVLPGEPGNAALAGHRTIRGRPAHFYDLDELEAGDEIQVAYPDRTLTFEVERVFLTSPYDLSVLAPTTHAALTLTTCDPPGSDEMRLIVQSRLVRDDGT